MDGILALGHFCEIHGPCVILSTQRSNEEPQQRPHSLAVPWCESCQSLDLDQALVSKNDGVCYVTTRTALQQDLAFLLKQATVRSLSCEEESSKDGGLLYFGDSERGHVITYTFSLQDSLARGFHRKYCILILMRDKIHLLNSWPHLTVSLKQIASDLKEKAANVNGVEQAQCSQRVVRQAQGSPGHQARSLSQLTGEPAIFAHLHMWFTWILSCERIVEKPMNVPQIPINCSVTKLKILAKEMDPDVFKTACYCILTGIPLSVEDEAVHVAFKQLLPTNFSMPQSGEPCTLQRVDSSWVTKWSGSLPNKLPSLLLNIEKALRNDSFPESALEPHLNSLILQWLNTAKALSWCPNQSQEVLQALGIHKSDLPLLAYWTSNCR